MNRRWVQLSSIIVHVPPVQPRVGGKLEVLHLFEIPACTLFIAHIFINRASGHAVSHLPSHIRNRIVASSVTNTWL